MFSAFSQDTFQYNSSLSKYVFTANTYEKNTTKDLAESFTKLWNEYNNSDNFYHSEMCLFESTFDELFTLNLPPEKKRLSLKNNKLV